MKIATAGTLITSMLVGCESVKAHPFYPAADDAVPVKLVLNMTTAASGQMAEKGTEFPISKDKYATAKHVLEGQPLSWDLQKLVDDVYVGAASSEYTSASAKCNPSMRLNDGDVVTIRGFPGESLQVMETKLIVKDLDCKLPDGMVLLSIPSSVQKDEFKGFSGGPAFCYVNKEPIVYGVVIGTITAKTNFGPFSSSSDYLVTVRLPSLE